jgi:hypothetical protein
MFSGSSSLSLFSTQLSMDALLFFNLISTTLEQLFRLASQELARLGDPPTVGPELYQGQLQMQQQLDRIEAGYGYY